MRFPHAACGMCGECLERIRVEARREGRAKALKDVREANDVKMYRGGEVWFATELDRIEKGES